MSISGLLLIYIVGCILSYYKIVAWLADEAAEDSMIRFFQYEHYTVTWVVFSSWIGFLAGVVTYFRFKDERFFKWSPKDHN